MRAELISILGLVPASEGVEVTDGQIVAAVRELKAGNDAASAKAAKEKAIKDLINQSVGALTYKDAEEIIANRMKRA